MKTAHHRFAVAILALLVLPVPACSSRQSSQIEEPKASQTTSISAREKLEALIRGKTPKAEEAKAKPGEPARKVDAGLHAAKEAKIEDADPIKAELDAVRKVHDDRVTVAKATFLKSYDYELKKLAAKGDLDGYKSLRGAKERIVGRLNASLDPDLSGIDPFYGRQADYRKKVFSAKKPLYLALEGTVKKYTMQLEIDKATAAQNEHKLLEIEALRSLGGYVSYDRRNLSLGYRPYVTDAALVYVQGWTDLEHLDLASSQITDIGLGYLKKLTNLTTLSLHGTQISNAGLRHLKRMAKLRNLTLSNTEITDAGLEHLKGMRGLRIVNLDRTNVTDTGIKKLQQALPKLFR